MSRTTVDPTSLAQAQTRRTQGWIGFMSAATAALIGLAYTLEADYTTPEFALGALATLLALGGAIAGAWIAVGAGLDLADIRETEALRQQYAGGDPR